MDSIRLIARSSASGGMARLLSSGPSTVGLIFLFSPEAGKVRPGFTRKVSEKILPKKKDIPDPSLQSIEKRIFLILGFLVKRSKSIPRISPSRVATLALSTMVYPNDPFASVDVVVVSHPSPIRLSRSLFSTNPVLVISMLWSRGEQSMLSLLALIH